jgi:hypothetical protein
MKEEDALRDTSSRYFLQGFLVDAFRPGPALQRLNGVFSELRRQEPRKPFVWESKYPHSLDLRPEVFSYDSSILDILVDNDIPALIKSVTGLDLHLAHVQLRKALRGDSYMDWHRDTHFYGGEVHGQIPPVHKIIFYPGEGGPPRLRLKLCPGSHLRYFRNRILDVLQSRWCKPQTILASDERFLLFNTSLLHAAEAEQSQEGSFRLIYSFCSDPQLAAFQPQAEMREEFRRRMARSEAVVAG